MANWPYIEYGPITAEYRPVLPWTDPHSSNNYYRLMNKALTVLLSLVMIYFHSYTTWFLLVGWCDDTGRLARQKCRRSEKGEAATLVTFMQAARHSQTPAPPVLIIMLMLMIMVTMMEMTQGILILEGIGTRRRPKARCPKFLLLPTLLVACGFTPLLGLFFTKVGGGGGA